ncbi:YodC family protein [Stenotrophomonas indicatrix]|uniref:YodC family protein n=1 Tax=Stenotrophomonas indicatrix TaxID=2045451 RepID=UPI0013118DA0|nr:DUF2158 domain-containing protein [Stenotrophomonas indicatrix]
MNFNPGDQVQLKSGGPIMTINSIEDGEAWCEWFDKNGEHHAQAFSLIVLTRYA